MAKATWKGVILAESSTTEQVEGNHYFPADSIVHQYLKKSASQTTCPWKGIASYYDIVVNNEVMKDGAWYYPTPKDAAKQIRGHVAFSRGVTVET